MTSPNKTFTPKSADVSSQRAWWVIDAAGKPLGRLATAIAVKLRGKDKPIFAPHVDTGDFVVVVNADKVKVTGNKARQMTYYRHSGFPGGLKQRTFTEMLDKHPTYPVEHAVRGMLPKNRLGRKLLKKLKVYTGPDHPHTAQEPQAMPFS